MNIRFLMVMLALFVSGCHPPKPAESELREQKLEHVVRIVMRQEGFYNLFVQPAGSNIIEEKQLSIKRQNRIFIADVPAGQHPWLLIQRDTKNRIWKVEFHVRTMSDLDVGGYRQPSGKTSHEVLPTVVQ